MLRWLLFVCGYLWLDPTGICRHDWMQVVGWNPLAPVGTEDCNSLAVCLGWNLFVSQAPNDGYPWSESSCVTGEERLGRLPCLPFCPGFLPEEEGVVSNSEGMEEMVAEATFDNVISWNSLKFFSFWSLDTASHVSTGIISRRQSGRILWGPSSINARLIFLSYSSAISSSCCTHSGTLSFFCSTGVWCNWPWVIVKKEAVGIPGLLSYISYHQTFHVFCDKVNKLDAKKRVLMWITLSSNNIASLAYCLSSRILSVTLKKSEQNVYYLEWFLKLELEHNRDFCSLGRRVRETKWLWRVNYCNWWICQLHFKIAGILLRWVSPSLSKMLSDLRRCLM